MLNEEEKKAIEIVKGLKTYYEAYYLLEDEEIKENEEKNEAIDTVLNLITKLERKIYDYDEIIARLEEENTKKDKLIIEQLKEDIRLQKELNEENNRCMILANNDKFKEQVMDLMAEIFYKRFKAELLLEYGLENEEQLKQYFIELAKKKGE